MKSEHKALSRSEITERIDDTERSMRDAEEKLEEAVDDEDVVHNTLENLDFSTTEEGGRDTRDLIEAAGDAVDTAIDERDDVLDKAQDESTEIEEDLAERAETAKENERTAVEGQERLHVRDALDQIMRCVEAIRSEDAFLEENKEQTRASHEASVDHRKALQARHGGG